MGAVDTSVIDFMKYTEITLREVAKYERAKKGTIYPSGTSTIQISATKGQCGYLEAPGEVHTKEVAIIPQEGINPKYLNIVIQKNMDEFLERYMTGLNIKESEIGNFPIQLHNRKTQDAVVMLVEKIEKDMEIEQEEIAAYTELKKIMLDKMMV
ncbi:hypothetical protein M2149_000797 [Lachnospiraceae bacterium PFB1-21]